MRAVRLIFGFLLITAAAPAQKVELPPLPPSTGKLPPQTAPNADPVDKTPRLPNTVIPGQGNTRGIDGVPDPDPGPGGGDPPGRPRQRSAPSVERNNDYEEQINEIMRKWNADAAFESYLKDVNKAWSESKELAHDITFVVNADDWSEALGTVGVDFLAKRVVEEIEKRAVEDTRSKLEAQFQKLRNSAHGWFDSAEDTQRKLAALQQHEAALRKTLEQARQDAIAHVNQTSASGWPHDSTVHVYMGSYKGGHSSDLRLKEGTAIRQARESQHPDWKTVLKEAKDEQN